MGDYIKPEAVTSPRRNWTLIRVLENGEQEDSYGCRVAIAIGTWKNTPDQQGHPVLGMRWNGNEDHPIGTPQSRGLPTWFIIPERLNEAVINTLSKDNQVLVKSLLNSKA